MWVFPMLELLNVERHASDKARQLFGIELDFRSEITKARIVDNGAVVEPHKREFQIVRMEKQQLIGEHFAVHACVAVLIRFGDGEIGAQQRFVRAEASGPEPGHGQTAWNETVS